jgi:protein-L-isoaspartate(D-aspartate) O-methyltransferase
MRIGIESAGMTSGDDSQVLRTALVNELTDAGDIVSPRVYVAMSAAPRHAFLPEVDLAEAYADEVVITKTDEDDRPLSSASAPSMVATMLEYAQIAPGSRCLEIGTGTGYNLWLMRHIAGVDGRVVSVEIDAEVVERAAEVIDTLNCTDVEIICGDGARGYLPGAPYDVIIVTAGSWDIPPAWIDQLAPDGRIVVPLRWRGQTRCLSLRRDGDVLVCEQMCLCGFIPMRNDDGEIDIRLPGDRVLTHDSDQDVDAEALAAAFSGPVTRLWSGHGLAPRESMDLLWLHVITTEHGACMVRRPSDVNAITIVEGDSLALLELAGETDEAGLLGLGATGYGPRGDVLAKRLVDRIGEWSADRGRQPYVTLYPAGTDVPVPVGRLIQKVFTRLVMSDEPSAPVGS